MPDDKKPLDPTLEWTFCTAHGTSTVNGSCDACNGDRCLIQVVPKEVLEAERTTTRETVVAAQRHGVVEWLKADTRLASAMAVLEEWAQASEWVRGNNGTVAAAIERLGNAERAALALLKGDFAALPAPGVDPGEFMVPLEGEEPVSREVLDLIFPPICSACNGAQCDYRGEPCPACCNSDGTPRGPVEVTPAPSETLPEKEAQSVNRPPARPTCPECGGKGDLGGQCIGCGVERQMTPAQRRMAGEYVVDPVRIGRAVAKAVVLGVCAEKMAGEVRVNPEEPIGKRHCGGETCEKDPYSEDGCECVSGCGRCGPWNDFLDAVEAEARSAPPKVEGPHAEVTCPVEVKIIGDDSARLFVNGYGIATWPKDATIAGVTGQEYANEVARCLRIALAGR